MADEGFNLEAVRVFMLQNNGKVRNHELVTYFKRYLNDPVLKAQNREKFKDFVNTLSTVKQEENGEKVLVLKKKFRDTGSTSSTSSLQSAAGDYGAPGGYGRQGSTSDFGNQRGYYRQASDSDFRDSRGYGGDYAQQSYSGYGRQSSNSEFGHPPSHSPVQSRHTEYNQSPEDFRRPSLDHASPIKENPFIAREKNTPDYRSPPPYSSPQIFNRSMSPREGSRRSPDRIVESSTSNGSSRNSSRRASLAKDGAEEETHKEETRPINVRERAQVLNKIQSDSDIQRVQLRKRESKLKSSEHTEGDDSSTTSITLSETDREWMLKAAMSDYHRMSKLLLNNPHLAKKPDFTNGTALHWGAKHGNPDIIKMIAGTQGVNVNARSGYTALHFAAMHGHEDIIELLVQAYGADPNLRDYSGKKPKQYLKNSASQRSQHLLATRKTTSILSSTSNNVDAATFSRTGSFSAKVRKTTHAISNLIMRPTRSSWAEPSDKENRRTTPSPRTTPKGTPSASPSNSPRTHRSGSTGSLGMRTERAGSYGREMRRERSDSFTRNKDQDLMPPPQAPLRKKKVKRKESETYLDVGGLEEVDEMDYNMPRPASEPVNLSDMSSEGLSGTLV